MSVPVSIYAPTPVGKCLKIKDKIWYAVYFSKAEGTLHWLCSSLNSVWWGMDHIISPRRSPVEMTWFKQEPKDPFVGTYWVNKEAEIRWRIAFLCPEWRFLALLAYSHPSVCAHAYWLHGDSLTPDMLQVLRPHIGSYTTLFLCNLLFRFPDLRDLGRAYFCLSFSFLLSRRKRWRLQCLRSLWFTSVELRPLFPEFI